MIEAPGTGGWPSSTSTGVVPAGLSSRKRLAALPDPLLDQAAFEPVLGQRQPDEARMRAERVMEQRQHEAFVDGALGQAGRRESCAMLKHIPAKACSGSTGRKAARGMRGSGLLSNG